MRQRILKPSFFKNEDLARFAPLIRIIFEGVWCASDRYGRCEDRPARLKVEIVPFDRVDMDGALQDLHDGGFITRYEVDGRRFIQVNAFSEHQNPHPKEPALDIPPPESLTSMPRKAIAGNCISRPAIANPPGSSGSSLTGSSGSSDPPNTPAPQYGAARSLLLAEFGKFWEAYPGPPTAKRKAEEKFLKARRAGVTLQVLLAALAHQVEARSAKTARGEWVPEWCNPATWLHQRRWEDETGRAEASPAPGPVPRAEWLRSLRDMRRLTPRAFESIVKGYTSEARAALEQELEALPAALIQESA